MPEYPDIVVYIEALEKRILGRRLERVHIASPFLLRTVTPSIASVAGKQVIELRRLGKRICIRLEDDLWLVLHLMIAGRLHWKEIVGAGLVAARKNVAKGSRAGTSPAPTKLSKRDLAAFDFENGRLTLTEAGTQRRASLHLVKGEAALRELDPGGLEVFALRTESGSDRPNNNVPDLDPGSQFSTPTSGGSHRQHNHVTDLAAFSAALQSENHTLKRALTNPHLFSGIGNAYSDEILFAARLSPVKLTQKLTATELERLYLATRNTLAQWVGRLREETGESFPERVTAFRPGMAVHGRYKQPCPRCGAKIQRIRYAANETNYCPVCQTEGKLLADRALSRLLRDDWPRMAEE